MTVEVQTKRKQLKSGRWVDLIRVLMKPRGSGNRRKAQRLAERVRASPLGPFISRIEVGSSSITIHVPVTAAMVRAVKAWCAEPGPADDVSGQMMMAGFGR